jgi:putative PIN family toxin of toxin-antitoxin system
MPSERRYVFDANVIVSAVLLPDSVPRRAFDKASNNGRIVLSTTVIEELDDVLRRPSLDKYISEEDRMHFLVRLVRECPIIDVLQSVGGSRDPDDNQYLALAVAAEAVCLVSGDRHLLELNPFRDVPILTPRLFLGSVL